MIIEDTNLRRILDTGNLENESDSGNETISSENVDMSSATLGDSYTMEVTIDCDPTLTDTTAMEELDIEAFIASMTVPPPPPRCDSPDLDLPPPPNIGFARASSIMSPDSELPPPPPPVDISPPDMTFIAQTEFPGLVCFPPPDVVLSTGNVTYVETSCEGEHLEDEFAMLVIPPPPECSKAPIDICIVPPLIMSPISTTTSPESVKGVELPPGLDDHIDNVTKSVSQTIDIYNLKSSQHPPSVPTNVLSSGNEKKMDENSLNAPKGVKSSVSIESLKERDFGTVAEIKNKLLCAKTKKGSVVIPNGRSSTVLEKKKERIPRPKCSPPPPPQRLTSIMSSQHSAPCSPTEAAVAGSAPLDISQRKALLWKPSDVRSADNSPVHRCKDLPGSGLLSPANTTARRSAPAPPLRRSSVTTSNCSTPTPTPPLTPNNNSDSPELVYPVSNVHPLQFTTFRRNTSSPVDGNKLANMYHGEHFNSDSNLMQMFGRVDCGNIKIGMETIKMRQRKSQLSYINSSNDCDDENITPRSPSIVDDGKPSEEPCRKPMSYIDELHAKAFPQGTNQAAPSMPIMGTRPEKPVVDNVPLSTIKLRPYRSPALVRREIKRSSSQSSSENEELRQAIADTETTGAEDSDMFTSGNANGKSLVGRSTSFGGAVTHSHASLAANRSSTSRVSAVHRHSSLSRMAERAASPLRALFGSNNSSSSRHKSVSDSEGSGSHRDSGITTGTRNLMTTTKSSTTPYRPLSTSTLPRVSRDFLNQTKVILKTRKDSLESFIIF